MPAEAYTGLGRDSWPLVSVVTVVRNAADEIERTLQSVMRQTYPHVEHIVIDGASNDGTLDILAKYRANLAYLLSEPDRGIYDAMNKGVAAARGDVVHLLNAGDTYIAADTVAAVAEHWRQQRQNFLSSSVLYVFNDGTAKPIKYSKGVDTIPHPGLFVARRVYARDQYSLSYKYASDIDFFLRVIKAAELRVIPDVTVRMPSGGLGSTKEALVESVKIYLAHRRLRSAFICCLKLIRRWVQ